MGVLQRELKIIIDLVGSRSGEFHIALTIAIFGFFIAIPSLNTFDGDALMAIQTHWGVSEEHFGWVSGILGLFGLWVFRFGNRRARLFATTLGVLYWLFLLLLVILERHWSPLVPLFTSLVIRASVSDLRLAIRHDN